MYPGPANLVKNQIRAPVHACTCMYKHVRSKRSSWHRSPTVPTVPVGGPTVPVGGGRRCPQCPQFRPQSPRSFVPKRDIPMPHPSRDDPFGDVPNWGQLGTDFGDLGTLLALPYPPMEVVCFHTKNLTPNIGYLTRSNSSCTLLLHLINILSSSASSNVWQPVLTAFALQQYCMDTSSTW